jgi:hypothetical protein
LNSPIVSKDLMFITKSTMTNDGLMRWSAVNSDIEPDLYGERMTLDLYRKMLSYIQSETPPPDPYKSMVCSDYWCGGMPYLSIAHYPDLNGKAVPGQPLELFIDGKQLKAKGILFDSTLGKAVWKSLKQDENLPENEKRIRISIAFLDLAHKHGEDGKTFKRESSTSICSECAKGEGNKIYLDGYLVHLALTRVPVNPRTIMQEDAMTKKSKIETRKEDAVSIVGDEAIVDEIEKSAMETKSDVLVEMSETEPLVEEAQAKVKEDLEEDKMPTENDEAEPAEKKAPKKMTPKSLTEEDLPAIIKSVVEELAKTKEDASCDEGEAKEPDPEKDKKTDTVSKSVLDLATDNLYNSVNSAIQMESIPLEQRLESINPALQEVGNAIAAMVRESMGSLAPAPVTNEQSVILEAISNLTQKIENVALEVATLKSAPAGNAVPNRIPVPRSITPAIVQQSQVAVNPNSIDNIARRSVSAQLQLK